MNTIDTEVTYTLRTIITYENEDNIKSNLNDCIQLYVNDLLSVAQKVTNIYISTYSKIYDN